MIRPRLGARNSRVSGQHKRANLATVRKLDRVESCALFIYGTKLKRLWGEQKYDGNTGPGFSE